MDKLGILGPENTFHDIARKKYIPQYPVLYYNDFDSIFTALASDNITKAFIAIENNSSGLVGNNLERIEKTGLAILATYDLPIKLHLGSLNARKIEELSKIYSHPMAIKETVHFFSAYPNITFEATRSTAAAIEKALKTKTRGVGVISSKQALAASPLLTIAESIEDEPNNATTFCLIEK